MLGLFVIWGLVTAPFNFELDWLPRVVEMHIKINDSLTKVEFKVYENVAFEIKLLKVH